MTKYFTFILFLFFIQCSNPSTTNPMEKSTSKEENIDSPFSNCNQLVLVTMPNDTTINGTMQRFEKQEKKWTKVGEKHLATLGKNGSGWGLGLHQKQEGYHRKEGDGKSPLGIFSFGSAFGYALEKDAPTMQLPYIHLDKVTQCIEDTKSKYYNQIVQDASLKDWDSSDYMRRDDHVYKWGVFVNHNVPPSGDAGSCIFMHLWRAPDKPTLGCTGMSEENMLALLQWLSPKDNPRLVQLLEKDYRRFQQKYALPNF